MLNEDHRMNIRSDNGLPGNVILSFSNFKKGKDGGIDLYYSAGGYTVIGQVKQSMGSFSTLMSRLKTKINGKNELDKVQLLDPDKYIFMTSMPLSLSNKEALKDFFDPYIKEHTDIYGREDLNKLLNQFFQIQRSHPKLYFNSVHVLERVFVEATSARSEFAAKEILDELPHFVRTTDFPKALSILEDEKLLIIKGRPGAGKTTLAKMLSLYFIERGYEFVEILDLDSDIERLLDIPGKRIFYFDDFLGSNRYLIKDAFSNEPRLSRLVRRIARSAEKALILTTRTNILKNAEYLSDKLPKMFNSLSKFEVDVTALSYWEKEEILRRHIVRSGISKDIFPESLVGEVVSHTSFTPRLVEFLTEPKNVFIHREDYSRFVWQSLKYPKELWANAYHQQIDHIDRVYLNHLFLFGNEIDESIFRPSFDHRLTHEVMSNNYLIQGQEFRKSTIVLDGTFISISSETDTDNKLIEFLNPSVIDFIIKEVKNSTGMIAGSLRVFDRPELLFERFNHHEKDLLKLFNHVELKEILLEKDKFQYFTSKGEKLAFLDLLIKYFTIQEIEHYYTKEIGAFLEVDLSGFSPDEYVKFLLDYKESFSVRNFMLQRYREIVDRLLSATEYENTFDAVLDIFHTYDLDFNSYIANEMSEKKVYETFKRILEDSVDHFIFIKQDNLFNMGDVEKLYSEAYMEFRPFFKKMDGAKGMLQQLLDAQDWQSKLKFNNFKQSGIE